MGLAWKRHVGQKLTCDGLKDVFGSFYGWVGGNFSGVGMGAGTCHVTHTRAKFGKRALKLARNGRSKYSNPGSAGEDRWGAWDVECRACGVPMSPIHYKKPQ